MRSGMDLCEPGSASLHGAPGPRNGELPPRVGETEAERCADPDRCIPSDLLTLCLAFPAASVRTIL